MPIYLYTCDQCPCENIEVDLLPADYSETFWCSKYNLCGHLDCTGTLHRVWSAPTIGRVEGAGESPPRWSK